MNSIRGVILCGGQSTRMGTDKGLIDCRNNTWAEIAIKKISSLYLDVCLSVNQQQLNQYVGAFSNLVLIKDDETLPVKGPLTGLLSVHLQYPGDDLLVLACDMPLMASELLNQLLATYLDQRGPQAYLFLNDDEPEPLCAIYTAEGMALILRLLREKKMARHSMKFMLQQLTSVNIPLKDDQKKYFGNFNTPEELNRLRL